MAKSAHVKEKETETLNFIDLFAGAGGLSCGLELAGLRCLLGVDHDQNAMRTFALNHKAATTYCDCISDLNASAIKKLTGGQKIHLVVGGPPCQGFSTVGRGDPEDDRNRLFLEFCRIVKITRPYYLIMENVTGLLASKNSATLKAIYQKFKKMGYQLNVKVLEAEKYGVPERRRRTIIIGSRLHAHIPFPDPTHGLSNNEKVKKVLRPLVTVGEALVHLQTKAGEIHNHDCDSARPATTLDGQRLQYIPEGKGIRYQKDEEQYLPAHLKLGVDWQSLRENRFRQTKYYRLDRSLPSPTIMTHRLTYYHPTECRFLTAREAAKLQSFPNDFIFTGALTSQWRQIGNAVPPLLAKALGKHILQLHAQVRNVKAVQLPRQKKNWEGEVANIRKEAFIYKPRRQPRTTVKNVN